MNRGSSWTKLLSKSFELRELVRQFADNGRPAGKSQRVRLAFETMESRVVPAIGATVNGFGPIQNLNWGYDLNGNPIFDAGLQAYPTAYQQPGTNALTPPPFNQNVPFKVNFDSSAASSLPPQSSDWWSNLMFRVDPTNADASKDFTYTNSPLFSQPSVLTFVNRRWTGPNATTGDETGAWKQGLNIFNPESFFINPGPTGNNVTTERQVVQNAASQSLTLGIGGNRSANDVNSLATEITPLGTPINHPKDSTDGSTGVPESSGVDERQLNVRVKDYSDWGVVVTYGNKTDKLNITMLNGNPFTYFQKTGTTAYAKLWLQATTPPGVGPGDLPDQGASLIQIWQNDNGRLGVTVTTYNKDSSGFLGVDQTSYLVIGSSTSTQWIQATGLPQAPDPKVGQLWTYSMGAGNIVVAVMPHLVNGQKFESFSSADKVKIANLFASVAGNIPTDAQVSNAEPSSSNVYKGQALGYDPKTATIRTKYTVPTANKGQTYHMLLPNMYSNLIPSTPSTNFQFALPTGVTLSDGSSSVRMSYFTLKGEGKLYHSADNSYVTELRHYGVLPALPSVAIQNDVGVAQALFDDMATWIERNLPDATKLFPALDNTYNVTLMQVSEQMQIADQLAAPTSALPAAERAIAAQWRDWMLGQIKQNLYSWFDPSTGRLFDYNTTYKTLIGYPAGFGSDFSINDHHFHYGYFLNAFAAVEPFDPAFVNALLPQITLLVNDIADMKRNDSQFPFLREFSPWAGHSWADGLGRGGNNQESASEAVSAWAGIEKLGMLLGNKTWQSWGAYMYETEIDAMNQYWFNTGANAATNNPGNLPAEFVQYQLNGNPEAITQIAKVGQGLNSRELFFAGSNLGESINAINWLPVAPQSLFLGRDSAYLQRNWAQVVHDMNLVGTPGNYQGVVAAYQALMPDRGMGIDNPGPSNALLRLDPTTNPAVLDPGLPFVDSYRGLSRTIVLDWVHTLQQLGQVDASVVANTPSYAVFVKDAQRSYVAFNPTNSPITVTFTDAKNSKRTLATLIVQPNETVTLLPSGEIIRDLPNSGQAVGLGTSLYLTKPLDKNPDNIKGSLSKTPGTAFPNIASGDPLKIANYANNFVSVPKRDSGIPNGNIKPTDQAKVAIFTSSKLNGNYVAGQKTGLDLFINNALTWDDQDASGGPNPKFGNRFGPGVAENQLFGNGTTAVIEVDYDFAGDGHADRSEVYTVTLLGGNQFYEFNTLIPTPGPVYNNAPDNRPILQPELSNLTPFKTMQNGTVSVLMWAGQYGGKPTQKEFAVAVNDVPEMARSSRVFIPYTDKTDALTVVNAVPVPPSPGTPTGPYGAPVNDVTVRLSTAAGSGSFTYKDVTLKRFTPTSPSGTGIILNSNVTVTKNTDGTYRVSGLASFQKVQGKVTDGTYVLTVKGAGIVNENGKGGSGSAIATWTVDATPPTVTLASPAGSTTSNSPIPVSVVFSEPVTDFSASQISVSETVAGVADGVISNFRGGDSVYAFDLTPTVSTQITVNIPANAVHDFAGNGNAAPAAPLNVTFQPAARPAQITTTAAAITNGASIPVTVTFPQSVSAFTAGNIVVTNGQISNFAGSGTTYTFDLLAPAAATTGPQTTSVTVPNSATTTPNITSSATFYHVFDQSSVQVKLTSTAPPVTFNAPIPVIVTFNKAVTNFTAASISASNTQVANFSGSGAFYQFELIPNDQGIVTASIMTAGPNVPKDAAGNDLAVSPLLSRSFEPMPSVSLFTTGPTLFTDPALKDPAQSTKTITVYAKFATPPVGLSGNLSPAVLQSMLGPTNATITSVQGLAGSLYAIQLKPTNDDVQISMQMQAGQLLDVYGRKNPQSNKLNLVYSIPPTLQTTTILDNSALANGFVHVQVVFSKPVTGIDATKLVGLNGVVTNFNGGGTTYDFYLTPTLAPNVAGKVKVTIPVGGIFASAPVFGGSSVTAAANSAELVLFDSISDVVIAYPTVYLTTTASRFSNPDSPASVSVAANFSTQVPGLTAAMIPLPSNLTIGEFKTTDNQKYTFTVTNKDAKPTGVQFNVPAGLANSNNLRSVDLVLSFTDKPVIKSVTSPAGNNTYRAGDVISIAVNFTKSVKIDTTKNGIIQLTLNTGGGLNNAVLVFIPPATNPGQTTSTLIFNYTVQPGQSSADLDYLSNSALVAPFGLITDANGVPLPITSLTLPDPGSSQSLAGTSNIHIVTGPAATGVVGVSTTSATGSYGVGAVIPIQVHFNNPVNVVGTPQLLLATGGGPNNAIVNFSSISPDKKVLTFNYTVAANQTSALLDYLGANALVLPSGAGITPVNTGPPADLTLPAPGSAASLEGSAALTIRGAQPRLLLLGAVKGNPAFDPNKNSPAAAFTPINPTGHEQFGANMSVYFALNFSDAVVVSGTPTLTLNSGGTAAYFGGSGSSQLLFKYTVAAGENTPNFGSVEVTAFTGTLNDLANNPVTVTLPTPGTAVALSGATPFAIVTSAPQVVSVTAAQNGVFNKGLGIDISVTFDRPVKVTSDPKNTFLELNVGTGVADNGEPAPPNAYVDKTTAAKFLTTQVFHYIVAKNQNSNHLDYLTPSALTGTFIDSVGSSYVVQVNTDGSVVLGQGNSVTNPTLPSLGNSKSLGASNLIVIHSTDATPVVTGVSATVPNGNYGVGRKIPVTVTFSAPVQVTGAPQLTLQLANRSVVLPLDANGVNGNILTFTYVVQAGDNSPRLDIASNSALNLNGGTIKAVGGAIDAVLTLPNPGAAGALGYNRAVAIVDTSVTGAPVVQKLTATVPDGVYGLGSVIQISVQFNGPVVVTGIPQLQLSTGGGALNAAANYVSGSGTNVLIFQFTVASGQNTGLLDVAGISALLLNGGAIKDAIDGSQPDGSGQNAILTLPAPDLFGSLSASSTLVIR